MADGTGIEWTDATWTPIRARNLASGKIGWHCEHESEGCRFCYAEGINKRLGTGLPFKPGHRGDIEIFLDEKMLLAPLKWKKPRRIFVCSMTDLFADFVTDEWIDRVFAVMALCPQHRFQVLTKRAKRMREWVTLAHKAISLSEAAFCGESFGDHALLTDDFPHLAGAFAHPSLRGVGSPLPNVWLGVSAEDQANADERIPDLLATPAAVRFVSLEPLLGPIKLKETLSIDRHGDWLASGKSGEERGLDWVIVGGESGPHARPMHPDWARSIRDQCKAADVPFFFKQWGEWLPWHQFGAAVRVEDYAEATRFDTREWSEGRWTDVGRPIWSDTVDGNIDDDQCVGRVGKKRAGRLLDGREWNEMPGGGRRRHDRSTGCPGGF